MPARSRLPATIALAAAAWLVLAGQVTAQEVASAALAGLACGLTALWSRPARDRGEPLGRRAAWRLFVRLPPRVAIDLWMLLRAAARPPSGALRTRELSHPGERWRAFAAVASSLPPGSVVVGMTDGALETHESMAAAPGPELVL